MHLKTCLREPGRMYWVFLDFCRVWEINVLFFKRFVCQIQPMPTYGSEVWGIMADYCIIERIHLFSVKRFLNVSTRKPSALVYVETARYPLYVNTYTRCIKYWLNLVIMPECLPSKSSKMLCDLHSKN